MPEQIFRLIVLSKYGRLAASTRQRFFQFERDFATENIEMSVSPLFDDNYLDVVMKGDAKPLTLALASYAARFRGVPGKRDFDGILVHCEIFPYAPAFLESLALPRGIPLIFDFDDAIFHQYDQNRSSVVRALLGGKLKPLLQRADLALCGNSYLREYAARYCPRTEIAPTVVDTAIYKPAAEAHRDRPVTIGWIGSPSTWPYVKPLIPLLSDLARRYDLRISIVGAGRQAEVPPRFAFHSWSEQDEIALIQNMDIGIMPLPDEPWARGKCGYKLIQYMACGLPVVASPVGVNSEIVDEGCNGFLATTEQQWATAIAKLVGSSELRRDMGLQGRRKVESAYSRKVHGPRLARLIRDVMARHMPPRETRKGTTS